MDPHAGKTVLNRMTRRRDRPPPALEPGYVPIDGRSLPQLLDFGAQIARFVRFVGPDNVVDGDWSAFFLNDPAMVLAQAAAFRGDGHDASFADLKRAILESRSEARKLELLREVVSRVLELAKTLDRWSAGVGSLRSGEAAEVFRRAIESRIQGTLNDELRTLLSYCEGAASRSALHEALPAGTGGLSPLWQVGSVCADGSVFQGRSRARRIDHALPAFAAVFGAFMEALSGLSALAADLFESAERAGGHRPHIALFLAFCRLFGAAQERLNELPARFADFYYRDVLREAPRGPTADSVYLTFTLDPAKGAPSALVPAGARFSAGKDKDDVDIVYSSWEPLRVGAARIDRLRALRAVSGPPWDGAAAGEPVVREVLESEIVPGKGPFGLFGRTAAGQSPSESVTHATMGFAVASPSLLLGGGQRALRLRAVVAAASAEPLRARLQALADATGSQPADVLWQVSEQAFRAYVTTPGGWVQVSYEVILKDDQLDPIELAFEIVLPPGAPPVAPMIAGGTATLKLQLRQDIVELGGDPAVKVRALSLLYDVELDEVSLSVEVSDLSDLGLSNAGGPIVPKKPFPPFGAAPGVGSYLEIRHPEIFAKRLERLSVRIDWFQLPPGAAGFKGHYRGYDIGLEGAEKPGLFDNRSFKVGLEVDAPGLWDLGAGSEGLFLFRTEPPPGPDADSPQAASPPPPDPEGKLASWTEIKAPEVVPGPSARRDPGADSALRITLIAPPEGFGDSVYAANMVAAVTLGAPDPERCKAECAARAEPLVEASKLLQASLELCGAKASSGDCRSCYRSSLAMCRNMMVRAVEDTLAAATSAIEPTLGAEQLRALRELAAAAVGAPAEKRGQALREWLDAVTAAAGKEAAAFDWKCEALLAALADLDDCEAGAEPLPPEGYAAVMATGLVACRAALDLARAQGLDACIQACARAPKAPKLPSSPWLPQARRVSLAYSAQSTVAGEARGDRDGSKVYHLLPFGDLREVDPAGRVRLLPAVSPSVEGSLLMGLSGLSSAESIPLLIHLAEAGVAGGLEGPKVRWEVSRGEAWIPLPVARGHLDGTRGLRRTGVVTLRVPEGEPADSAAPPGNLRWIRACVEKDAATFPDAVGLWPYAAIATWRDNGNTGEHLSLPRPPGAIKASMDKLEGIKTVAQPVASFGGRPPETYATMKARLSERLRHKGRAIAGRDYDRLVLEDFPEIDRVRTLAASDAPGEVTVIVLPDPARYEGPDPTIPAVSPDTREQIAEALSKLTSPFVKVHVESPVYVRLHVTAVVVFEDGQDPTEGKARLSAELLAALSPGALDPPWVVAGQDYPAEDDIAELIRTRHYVSGVVRVELGYDPDPAGLRAYYLTSALQHRIVEEGEGDG